VADEDLAHAAHGESIAQRVASKDQLPHPSTLPRNPRAVMTLW
jgi:hypothetical protein